MHFSRLILVQHGFSQASARCVTGFEGHLIIYWTASTVPNTLIVPFENEKNMSTIRKQSLPHHLSSAFQPFSAMQAFLFPSRWHQAHWMYFCFAVHYRSMGFNPLTILQMQIPPSMIKLTFFWTGNRHCALWVRLLVCSSYCFTRSC